MSSDPWLLLRPNIILRSFAGAQLHTRNWHMAPGQSGRIAQYKLVCSPCTVGSSGVTSRVQGGVQCGVHGGVHGDVYDDVQPMHGRRQWWWWWGPYGSISQTRHQQQQ